MIYGILRAMSEPDWFRALDQFSTTPEKEQPETQGLLRNSKSDLAKMAPDGKIDLHGLTAEQSTHALRGFLGEARLNGWTKLLVVHGKGIHSENDAVLKKLVFRWAESQAGLRLEKAPLKHGGSGASILYLTGKNRT